MHEGRSLVQGRIRSKVALVFGGVAFAALVVQGIALATIPDANSVIHACRKTDDGSVRIIDSDSESCTGAEKELTWIHEARAGIGLTGGGPENDPLDVSFKVVQRRVAQGCPSGSAIRQITSGGNVVCEEDPVGFVGQARGGPIPNDDSAEARLRLPAGRYLVSATLNVGTVRGASHTRFDLARCDLAAAGGALASGVFKSYGQEQGGMLALTLPVRMTSPGTVVLNCFDRGERPEYNEMLFDSLTMSAVSLQTLTEVSL